MISSTHFQYIYNKFLGQLLNNGVTISTENWQAIKAPQPMVELFNKSFIYQIPESVNKLAEDVKPNLPWADIHFMERVGGEPLNPGESYKQWPFYKMDKEMRTEGEKFSHTYMERFWPKFAGIEAQGHAEGHEYEPLKGIRYNYGDLNDLINQFVKDPLTRQAYLPVFFPEDTGNVMCQRVPCTLGYHFIVRGGKMHVIYYIRSCDFRRHFRDDVYLACLLAGWIANSLMQNHKWENLDMGTLTMHITSLHVFQSDIYALKKEYEKNNQR